ncbi:prepilin-type N-terminal cleavage/methylation domain-containing protein [Bdellovibrio sp.]|uniref:type IV pilin protein n=1 Tax=Bdellovibrio sp. TaxID=28201 RepID=UPI003221E0E7
MFSSKRKSQSGFSLVELMVVVAIIGVLASIAVPNISKYLAKARQSEAKTNLASLYTSEKAFYAEYTAYHTQFGAVGYSPEGKLRYKIGFAGAGTPDAGVANGYTTVPSGIGTSRDSFAYCGVAVGMPNGCMMLNGATNLTPNQALPATSLSGTAFVAGAAAIIHTNGVVDQWTMDQNKSITNTNPAIR